MVLFLLVIIDKKFTFHNANPSAMNLDSMREPRIAVIRRSLYTEVGKLESPLIRKEDARYINGKIALI